MNKHLMEQHLYKPLPFKHISEVTEEALEYVDMRRKHEIEHLEQGGRNSIDCVMVA